MLSVLAVCNIGLKRGPRSLCIRSLSFFDKSGRVWENAWQDKNTPWETGSASAGLIHAFESPTTKAVVSSCKHALVPGCGSGYDVKYLQSLSQFDSITGIDLSSTAIEVAKVALGNTMDRKCNTNLLQADYFNWQPDVKFDFIFDYLFFVAIDIPARQLWADSTRRLMNKDGILLTKLFPLYNEATDTQDKLTIGPPYLVRLDDYHKVLEANGFKLVLTSEVPNSIKPRRGREMLAFWRLS